MAERGRGAAELPGDAAAPLPSVIIAANVVALEEEEEEAEQGAVAAQFV